jgi:hypothetical protein
MPSKTIFSLFSQRYLLRRKQLVGKTAGHLRISDIDIDDNLNSFWQVKNFHLYFEIRRDFDKLISTRFHPYSTDTQCVVGSQPSWNMRSCMSDSGRNDEMPINQESPRNDPVQEKDPLTCRKWRMEHWAYYSPAHTNKSDRYGIHLTKRGIAKLAHQGHQFCPEEPLEIVQLAAVYKLYAHEMCHAWIEDICCLIDFSECETAPKLARRYAQTQKRYHSYIFMEEAICNTAAYGWLKNFLFDSPNNRDPSMPPFNPQNILDAFEKCMRAQPPGYRDFLAIKELPYQSEIFVQNVCRLLVEVYGEDSHKRNGKHSHTCHKIAEAVGTFFGGCIALDCPSFHSHDKNRWDSLWAGKLPLHIER